MVATQRTHLERVRRERRSYVIRQKLARSNPDKFLSLIIDGADSSPYMVPHMAHRNHASSAAPKVKIHVLGCIAHGRDTYAFTCPPHIGQGHNVTIQVLDRVLTDIKRAEGRVPPILHIQLDNTTKQNKGRYLMAYLGYLVHMGVVQEAYCNFLPVGHTHEDIDQFFSRVSVYTRHHDALCVGDLHRCIRKSYQKYGRSPKVFGWTTVANLSGFLKPYIQAGMSKDITCYYQLRISLCRVIGDDYMQPIMRARTWPGAPANDKEDFWRGLLPDTNHVRIFKEGPPPLLESCHDIPTQSQPEHVGQQGTLKRTNYITSLSKQTADLEQLMNLFPSTFKEYHRRELLDLMKQLGSNLNDDVSFDWDKSDMDFLYRQGEYNNQGRVEQKEQNGQDNLFHSPAVEAIMLSRPDPQVDPEGFQQALQTGQLRAQDTENCHACKLKVGNFYIARPHSGDSAPFRVYRVKKTIPGEGAGTQWGAWAQLWECSTSMHPQACYIDDPYHAHAGQRDGQTFRATRTPPWTYEKLALSTFQDDLAVTARWTKPKGWAKELNGGAQVAHGVPRKSIAKGKNGKQKVQYFLARWRGEAENDGDESEEGESLFE